MTNSMPLNRDQFLACNWQYDVLPEDHFGYSSVMGALQKSAKEKFEAGYVEQSKVLELLGRAASMMLNPSSKNEPFKALFQDFQAGRRSALPEDFTLAELAFFQEIISDINELRLKARLADLLWLCNKPKNPAHAKIAIESYISYGIDSDSWRCDVGDGWERATRLCIQIRALDQLSEIKNQLFSAFGREYPSSKFMSLWLADFMDRLNLDSDLKDDIASRLFKIGNELLGVGDFNSARSYFELASKKYYQLSNEKDWLKSLISLADCFELEADSRVIASNMAANSFYENAIQAYRQIPTKNRDEYNVNYKIAEIRKKISASGKASLNEMGVIKTEGIDISDMIKASKSHVSGKENLEEALIHFAGLYRGPNYSKLKLRAKETMQHSIIGSLFGSTHMSSDGRVVAKTPSMSLNAGEDDPANQAFLNRQMHQHFGIESELVVDGNILPALQQLLMEHTVSKEFLVTLCHYSPIVAQDRENLLGSALWLGFEHDFGNAIHLLCPQVEHIVRIHLKDAGAHTSNIDREGIENENGMSTLMELPEAIQIFGENLHFEFRSVFTDSLGFNLRNEVAHGLLNDKSSSTKSAVYAWWMILRLVIRSMTGNNFK